MAEITAFLSQTQTLLVTAAHNRHRVLITLAGEHCWAEQQASALLEQQQITPLWVSDGPQSRSHTVDFNSSRRWLGREVPALVFDAHTGFDPNAFALLCGTVCAGGALILLTPALDSWDLHHDPVNNRCGVWGQSVQRSRYLGRLAARIPAASQLLLQQPHTLQMVTAAKTVRLSQDYRDQAQLVNSLGDKFDKNAQQLAVISGDRGRGKSAALGQLAAELVRRGARRLILSAPRKAAVEIVMQHAREHWPLEVPALENCLRFVPPDQLTMQPQDCDVLLVDEMGGVHLGLLTRLLAQYPRLILAGTVHGYEGAGRGFHTRLRKHIHEKHPHCQWNTLKHPIRWACDDPLERSCNSLLLLDADDGGTDLGDASFAWVDRDALACDERLLRQVYGLLATAHYRTRPLDLRQILDGPNMRLAVLRGKDSVLAACLIATEGPLHDTELAEQIMKGKRRPAGHLLPQLLLLRHQLGAAAEMQYWRIVRIAVQPELQNRGLGSKLLSSIQSEADTAGIDCIGSLFAVDLPVYRFWTSVAFEPVLLGDNCEATSGSYALTVLRPLSQTAISVVNCAKQQWRMMQKPALQESHPALSQELCAHLEQAKQHDIKRE